VPAAPAQHPLDEPFRGTFDLTILDPANGGDGTYGFVIRGGLGTAFNGQHGHRGFGGDDINGDGIDDFALIDPLAYVLPAALPAGELAVLFGRPQSSPWPAEVSIDPVAAGEGFLNPSFGDPFLRDYGF